MPLLVSIAIVGTVVNEKKNQNQEELATLISIKIK